MVKKGINHILEQHAFPFRMSMLFFLCFSSFMVFGQQDLDDEGPIIPDSLRQTIEKPVVTFDSLKLQTYYLDNIHAKSAFRDSFLDYRFLHYNPVYEQALPHLFLGNNGSASVPVTQIHHRNSGFDLGIHSYDIYTTSIDSFRWFETNIPFSDLFFSNGPSSEDFRVTAKFGMNFSEGLNLNLDYKRIIETGYYAQQESKQSSLAIGLRHRSKNKRSNTFFNLINNVHQEENNGGISDTSYFSNPNNNIRIVIPVNLKSAVGRLQNNQFSIINYYSIKTKADSLVTDKDPKFELINSIGYENGFFKYTDEGTSTIADSLYYSNLLIDSKGIRHYISYNKVRVSPAIQAIYLDKNRLKIGAQYDWWLLNQEPQELKHLHDVQLFGKVDYTLTNWAGIKGKAQYHFGSFQGDFNLEANGFFKIKDFLLLEASQTLQSSHPSIIEQGLFISTQAVSSNNFESVKTSRSVAGLSIPRLGFSTSLSYDNIRHHIFYDPENLFQQMESPLQILDFKLGQNFKVYNFHFDIEGHLYTEDAEEIEIPDFHLYSRLYYKGPILKNRLFLNTGFEVRWMDSFFIPGYQATVGKFYSQHEFLSKAYPLINFYIGFKVGSFRFFARTEDILNAFTNEVHFQTYLYPQSDFKSFRMGIRWQFLD